MEKLHKKNLRIFISLSIGQSFYWGFTWSDQLSTKLATWRNKNNVNINKSNWSYKWIRKLNITPKIKNFLSQKLHDALPTRGNLVKKKFAY